MISKRNGTAAAVCGYECAALCSGGRLPTISALCEHYPLLSAVAVIALTVHLLPAAAEARIIRVTASWPRIPGRSPYQDA
jgi:hypothetical protein